MPRGDADAPERSSLTGFATLVAALGEDAFRSAESTPRNVTSRSCQSLSCADRHQATASRSISQSDKAFLAAELIDCQLPRSASRRIYSLLRSRLLKVAGQH